MLTSALGTLQVGNSGGYTDVGFHDYKKREVKKVGIGS